MSDEAVQFEEAIRHSVGRDTAPPAIEALAALHLGIGLMLSSDNPLVRYDFEEEKDMKWPIQLLGQEFYDPIELEFSVEKRVASLEQNGSARDERVRDEQSHLYGEMFSENRTQARIAGVAFCIAGLYHPAPLVRVSAAIAVASLSRHARRQKQAMGRMIGALRSTAGPLVQQIASIGWHRARGRRQTGRPVGPNTEYLRMIENRDLSAPQKANTSVLVHGTIFQKHGNAMEEWWRPADQTGENQGDFHRYLQNGPRPDVYNHQDFYRWSGGWNDYSRTEAAVNLVHWMDVRRISSPDVFSHSHGCNVAMLASHARAIDHLVLMSCPVWPEYTPGPNVEKTVSIRVKWDLVIMADGAAQRFPKSLHVREHVLPIWFAKHEAPRQSKTWTKELLDQYLRD